MQKQEEIEIVCDISRSDMRKAIDYIVAPTTRFSMFTEAQAKGIAVVCAAWVDHSVLCRSLQPTDGYLPDPSLFFTGCVVLVDPEIPFEDRHILFAGVEYFGGRFETSLTDSVTHYVVQSSRAELFDTAESIRQDRILRMQKELELDFLNNDGQQAILYKKMSDLSFKMVVPHFFEDCFRLKRRLFEAEYLYPSTHSAWFNSVAPSLPAANSGKKKSSSDKVDLDPIKELSALKRSDKPNDVKLEFFLRPFVFYFDPDIEEETEESQVRLYKTLLEKCGGILRTNFTGKIDYVITNTQGKVFDLALEKNIPVGTLYWLLEVIERMELFDPKDLILAYPWPKCIVPGFENFVISVTGFRDRDRELLKLLMKRLGAEYSRNFSARNTHLIACRDRGKMLEAAKEKGITVVNHLWLEDCWINWSIQSVANERYLIYRESLGRSVGQIPVSDTCIRRQISTFLRGYNQYNNNSSKRGAIEAGLADSSTILAKENIPKPAAAVDNTVNNHDDNNSSSKKKDDHGVKIIFTGYRPPQIMYDQLRHLNLITDDIKDATHLCSDSIKNTEKFLVSMASVPNFVSPAWIEACFNEEIIVDAEPYLLKDETYEKEFGINLQDSLSKARKRKVFEKYAFILTDNIKDPSKPSCKRIIEAHGGKVLSDREAFNKIEGKTTLAISSKTDQTRWNSFKANRIQIFGTDFVILSVLHQDVFFGEGVILG